VNEEAVGQEEPGLYWPIKLRFRAYVEHLDDGVSAAGRGATDLGRTYRFSVGDIDVSEPSYLRAAFVGEVRFRGHHGMLLVSVRDPAIEVRDDKLSVTIAYPWLAEGPVDRLEIARADACGHLRTDRGVEITAARLTDDGSELFGGTYRTGEPLDDMTIVLPVQGPALRID
jgi:hypothetical protein